ncbi:MAG: ATP-grasp domain-containing protein [Candidatus Hodarchaeales archaeon]
MKLYEHESKKVFESNGIPIPKQFGLVHSIAEIDMLDLQFPVMVKAAVLTGGRGKAGGIKKVNTLIEAKEVTGDLLRLKIKEHPVETVFFEEAVEECGAFYLGFTTDPKTFNSVLVVSAAGGVDIEEIAHSQPESILKREIAKNDSVLEDKVTEEATRYLTEKKQLSARQETVITSIISNLYKTFQEIDAKLCEINPVIITPDNIIAADAKIVLDDNALYRQSKLLEILRISSRRHDIAEPTLNEKKAFEMGFPFVDLLPSIITKAEDMLYVGLVPGGAGYGIFAIDEVKKIGEEFYNGKVVPVNFMDSGGGPTQNTVANMFHLLMDHPLPDIIITSRFGGISSCDIFIRGLIQALRERYRTKKRIIPIYGRMVGTDLPSAKTYLERAKVETPKALQFMEIEIGNENIMANVIKKGINLGFGIKKEEIT